MLPFVELVEQQTHTDVIIDGLNLKSGQVFSLELESYNTYDANQPTIRRDLVEVIVYSAKAYFTEELTQQAVLLGVMSSWTLPPI